MGIPFNFDNSEQDDDTTRKNLDNLKQNVVYTAEITSIRDIKEEEQIGVQFKIIDSPIENDPAIGERPANLCSYKSTKKGTVNFENACNIFRSIYGTSFENKESLIGSKWYIVVYSDMYWFLSVLKRVKDKSKNVPVERSKPKILRDEYGFPIESQRSTRMPERRDF